MSDLASVVPNGHGPGGPVNRVFSPGHAGPIARASRVVEVVANRSTSLAGDRVELSDFARYLDQLNRLPEARIDRVAHIRQAIAEDVYETDEKVDAAIERLAEDELI